MTNVETATPAPRSDEVNEDFHFDFGSVKWEEYEAYRPPYPEKLWELLWKHHADAGGSFGTALDVGAGGGVSCLQLLKKFSHVVFSDLSEGYVAQAKQRFAAEAAQGRMNFVQRGFNEFRPQEDFPNEEHMVDMITAGTCIHFGDSERVMQQLGANLRSKGTLATYAYGIRAVFPPEEAEAQAAMDRLLENLFSAVTGSTPNPDELPMVASYTSRYRNCYFDPQMWTNVRRITSLRDSPIYVARLKGDASRVQPGESAETVEDEFMSRVVSAANLAASVVSLLPGMDLQSMLKEEMVGLAKAMGGRQMLVKWPAIIILATKR